MIVLLSLMENYLLTSDIWEEKGQPSTGLIINRFLIGCQRWNVREVSIVVRSIVYNSTQ